MSLLGDIDVHMNEVIIPNKIQYSTLSMGYSYTICMST